LLSALVIACSQPVFFRWVDRQSCLHYPLLVAQGRHYWDAVGRFGRTQFPAESSVSEQMQRCYYLSVSITWCWWVVWPRILFSSSLRVRARSNLHSLQTFRFQPSGDCLRLPARRFRARQHLMILTWKASQPKRVAFNHFFFLVRLLAIAELFPLA